MLYLCATPIGNLGDITLRALQCLKKRSLLQWRVSGVPVNCCIITYQGSFDLLSERQQGKKGREILDRVKQGQGCPDYRCRYAGYLRPGSHLVRMLLAEKVPLLCCRGRPRLTALVLSGYSIERFVFWGLSRKGVGPGAWELAAGRNGCALRSAAPPFENSPGNGCSSGEKGNRGLP